MSNVIYVNFKDANKATLEERYPYILAFCQFVQAPKTLRQSLLRQAVKDRPGCYATHLFDGGWHTLHDMDNEMQEALMDLVYINGGAV